MFLRSNSKELIFNQAVFFKRSFGDLVERKFLNFKLSLNSATFKLISL
ncbi:hypothetical protein N200_01945 [Helicobacter pylori UM065]|nr:hypothetical protein N200_01945 [Helicobacter pylori UM065]